MKPTLVFLITCMLSASAVSAQGEYVVEINRTNGAFTETGPPIAGITYVYADDRTIDESTGALIFPSSSVNHALYSVDVVNDSILHNPLINNLLYFEFDNISQVLYGIEQDNTNNVKYLVSVNRATGVSTRIGSSMPSSSMYSSAYSAFNKQNHTYAFIAPPNILYSLDGPTGTVLSNPTLVLASGESIVNISYNASTGILYGLLQDANVSKYFLVAINPSTGVSTRIGPGTTNGFGNGSSSIDEANQQYMYMYSNGTGYFISTLDIPSGNLLHNALVQAYTANDNFLSVSYDNQNGKLYGIHWQTNSATIVRDEAVSPVVSVYPNPGKGIFTFDTKEIQTGFVEIYDVSGRRIYSENIYSDKMPVDLSNQPEGIFFYRLLSGNKVIKSGKIILQ